MKLRKSELVILMIVLISIAVSIYFYPKMPKMMASHWNYRGEVDGYMSKFWALFLPPLVLFVLWLLYVFIPKLDPLKNNIENFRKYFDRFIVYLFVFFLIVQFFMVLWQVGIFINPNFLFSFGMAVLFYFISVLMDNSKRNWFIGLRTPWTLSSDMVWEKTHKLGAKLVKISSAIALLGIPFKHLAVIFVLLPIIVSFIYLTIYSYLEYKRENN